MQILTVYSPEDSGLIRLWQRSWAAHGWKPGLISPKELQNQSVRTATKARKAKCSVSVRTINYGHRPRQKNFHVKRYGAPGWRHARIVMYPPSFSEQQILAARAA
jgi:hypothetical protein